MPETGQRFTVIGTAGHIDHGKSTLVQALTGKPMDRLKEERDRGISIDIDFAPLRFDDGCVVGLVDVPGHERFIRNMLAGAAGIDAALFVVDANEGVMPQTLEHAAILELLGVREAVIALTKIDAVDEELIELVKEDIRTAFEDTPFAASPFIPVSAKIGQGLKELRDALHALAQNIPVKESRGSFRMPIDRVFSLPGFGTVVTGTVWRGSVRPGDYLELLPLGNDVRVRSIQSHGNAQEIALAGQRAALGVPGLRREQARRGDVLCAPGTLTSSKMLDVRISTTSHLTRTLRHRHRVHVHLGTAETTGRILLLDTDEVAGGESALAQVVLDNPLVCEAGDHFVVRSYSPVTTIAGGTVINASPTRLHRRHRAHVLAQLERAEEAGPLQRLLHLAEKRVVEQSELTGLLGLTLAEATETLRSSVEQGALQELHSGWASPKWVDSTLAILGDQLQQAHQRYRFRQMLPLSYVDFSSLRDVNSRNRDWLLRLGETLGFWDMEAGSIRHHDWRVELSPADAGLYRDVLARLAEYGLNPPQVEAFCQEFPKRDRVVRELLVYATDQAVVLEVMPGYFMMRAAFDKAVTQLRQLADTQDGFRLAEARDALGISREPALRLLEALDTLGYTRRSGDKRVWVGR